MENIFYVWQSVLFSFTGTLWKCWPHQNWPRYPVFPVWSTVTTGWSVQSFWQKKPYCQLDRSRYAAEARRAQEGLKGISGLCILGSLYKWRGLLWYELNLRFKPGRRRSVPNRVLRHLPKRKITSLTNVFNAILSRQHFPPVRKHARVVSIVKPGRPHAAFFLQTHHSTWHWRQALPKDPVR
jgi:hypothetical protein